MTSDAPDSRFARFAIYGGFSLVLLLAQRVPLASLL